MATLHPMRKQMKFTASATADRIEIAELTQQFADGRIFRFLLRVQRLTFQVIVVTARVIEHQRAQLLVAQRFHAVYGIGRNVDGVTARENMRFTADGPFDLTVENV